MKTVNVNAEALETILLALIGPPHLIRELQAVSDISGKECPISILREQYNAAVAKHNTIVSGIKPTQKCDHDWEDIGDHYQCTYPECQATKSK